MKKLLLAIAIIMGFLASANAQQDKARVPGDENNYVFASITGDSQTSSSIKFYNNSTKSITVCVSVLNDQNKEVGRDCYEVSGRANGQMVRLPKMRACENTTSGCEAKRIKITSVE
ncbi:MAG: hypothetical protein IJK85_00475 [Bacteroidales bacterium]|nr:hypothetical protein [Bacteroidales bacterium]